MKKFLNEFKEFAVKGNMIDIAVGMIVGAAFTAVVTSLVNDIFMPLLGLLTAGFVDFATLGFYVNRVFIPVGNLINAIINFIAIAFVVFLLVKAINTLREKTKKKEEEAPAPVTTKICPFCRTEIAKEACKCPNCTSDVPVEE